MFVQVRATIGLVGGMRPYYLIHWFEPSIAHRARLGPRPAQEQDSGAFRFQASCYQRAIPIGLCRSGHTRRRAVVGCGHD